MTLYAHCHPERSEGPHDRPFSVCEILRFAQNDTRFGGAPSFGAADKNCRCRAKFRCETNTRLARATRTGNSRRVFRSARDSQSRQRRAEHSAERRSDSRHVRKARPNDAAADTSKARRRSWSPISPRRSEAHDRVLRALRRPTGRSRAVEKRSVETGHARSTRATKSIGATRKRSIRSGALYARSAGDDKAPIIAMLAALDALRVCEREAIRQSPLRLRRRRRSRLTASRRSISKKYPKVVCVPTPGFSATVRCIKAGGWNCLRRARHDRSRADRLRSRQRFARRPLRKLGAESDRSPDASARFDAGRERPDFDQRLSTTTSSRRPPPNAQRSRKFQTSRRICGANFRSAATEGDGKPLNELLMLPALNVRGIESGHVGAQASNTIQTEARASIDFRLVPNETPESIKPLVERHLEAQGYTIVRETPDAATRLATPEDRESRMGRRLPAGPHAARSAASRASSPAS